MANFLTRAFGGVEHFLGINQPQKPQQPQPLQQPTVNFNNLKTTSLRQNATPPALQQPAHSLVAPTVSKPTTPPPVQPPSLKPVAQPGILPTPVGQNTTPFVNSLVHGGLQVPQNATTTYHDKAGNVIGWEDNQGSHLTTMGTQQQDAAMAATQPKHTNPVVAIGKALVPTTAKFINTVRGGIIAPIEGNIMSNIPALRGGASKQDIQRAAAQESTDLLTGSNKGLLGVGSVYKNQADLNDTSISHILKKTAGTEAGGAAEILPWFVGAGEANAAAKGTSLAAKSVAAGKVVGTGAAIAGTGDAGQQLADTGKINPAEVFKSAAIGGATAGAVHGGTQLIKGGTDKVLSKLTSDARDQITNHLATNPSLNKAYQDQIATKAIKQQLVQHLASNPHALNMALNQTTAHIIAAVPEVSGNEAAVASIRNNSELGNVLHHALNGDETSLEHSLRQVLPGAPEDVIQKAKNAVQGTENAPLVTEPTPSAQQLQDAKSNQNQANAQAVQDAQDGITKAQEQAAKEATDAAAAPRTVTPDEANAIAASGSTPDIHAILDSANTGASRKELTQIAHELTGITDPKEVSAVLNSKGILTDAGQQIDNGTAVAADQQAALDAANGVQNGTPLPDTAASEKAIGQNAPVASGATAPDSSSNAIAQNDVTHPIDAHAQAIADKATTPDDHVVAASAQSVAAREKAPIQAEQAGVEQNAQSVADREAALQKLREPTQGKTANNTTYTERIAHDQSIPQESRDAITNLTHEVHSDDVLISNSKKLVDGDINTARQLFDERALVNSANPDAHIHLGNALVDKYNAAGDAVNAGKVYDQIISEATRTGQAFRALQAISKVSPQSIVKYAQNIAESKGIKMAPELKAALTKEANRIAKMPDGDEKSAAIVALKEMAQQKDWKDKTVDAIGSILSIPRALMATGDDSFPGRQGAVLGAAHPVVFMRSIKNGIHMALDGKYFEQRMGQLMEETDKNGDKLFTTYKKMGLDLPALAGKSEEQFGNTNLIEGKLARKLLIGRIASAADRAYSGTAAELRTGVVKDFVDNMGGLKGLQEDGWTKKDFHDYGRVINTATGRGQGKAGGWFEKAAPTLGQTLFSARLWKSRLDLLNPLYYAKLSPAARSEAVKSSLAFTGVVVATLTAAKAAGADVEVDPRSSDFGKIKIGNTRYDIMGGLQQNIVLATREITGEKKNSAGVVSKLDGGYGHQSRFSVASDFLDNKTTPVINAAIQLAKGKDAGGNPVNPWTTAAKLVIPLGIQDTYSLYSDRRQAGDSVGKSTVEAIAGAAPGFGGAGVQTYQPTGSNTTPGAPGVDPSKLSPTDLTKYSKAVDTQFQQSLSPADQKTYALLSNKDAQTFALRNGSVTQDQLDEMTTRQNQAKDKAGLPITYIGGVTDKQYQSFDPATQAVIKQASLQGATKYKNANIDPNSQKLIEQAAQNAWPGIGTIKPTNAMALQYVQLEKAVAEAPGDQGKQYEAVKSFWKGVVKDQYSDPVSQVYEDANPDTTNETSKGYGFSSKDIQRLASGITLNGKEYKLTKTDLDGIVSLDNRLLVSGLIDSPKMSNKVRASLGYGDAPTSGASGVGYGGSTSTAGNNPHADSFVTSFGSGSAGGGGDPFLSLVPQPKDASSSKIDLSKFRAPTSKPSRITINL